MKNTLKPTAEKPSDSEKTPGETSVIDGNVETSQEFIRSLTGSFSELIKSKVSETAIKATETLVTGAMDVQSK